MSNYVDDGGPAFPRQGVESASLKEQGYKGMSLRDYFAAQALAGMNASLTNAADWPADDGCALMARSAYAQADAMLKAREVKS